MGKRELVSPSNKQRAILNLAPLVKYIGRKFLKQVSLNSSAMKSGGR